MSSAPEPEPSAAAAPQQVRPGHPLMADQNLDDVSAQLHDVLDEVLAETTTGWSELATELASALREAEPTHPLLQRPEVARLLKP